MSWIRQALAAAITVGAVVVAGAACQSTAKPGESEKSTESEPSNTPRATPSPELPEAPGLIEQRSEAGAIAFLEYYYDLVNYGRATDNWKPAQSVTNKSCKECRDFWAYQPKRMNDDRRIRIVSADEPRVSRFLRKEASVTATVTSDEKSDNAKDGKAWLNTLRIRYLDGVWRATSLKARNAVPFAED